MLKKPSMKPNNAMILFCSENDSLIFLQLFTICIVKEIFRHLGSGSFMMYSISLFGISIACTAKRTLKSLNKAYRLTDMHSMVHNAS